MTTKLIQCGDHQWAPWSAVCKCLLDGNPDWVALPSNNPEVEFDWVCSNCLFDREETGEWDLDKLVPVCIHCVRFLRKKFDPNFELDNLENQI